MIHLKNITKVFPGVKSLDNVTFEARAGEVHALLGENGAGKSTLIKTMAGAYIPEEGEIVFDGQPRKWDSPKQAKDAGIHVIYQELMLFPELSVAENIFIGEEPRKAFGQIDHKAMRSRATDVLARLGHQLDPSETLKNLTVADQQMVEIAKALVGDTKLLVLDEPTAAISGREAALLFERVNTLKAQGVCIIYISHRLEEIFEIADRVTVLKDGQYVGTETISDINEDSLVGMMVGRELSDIYPEKSPRADDVPVLTVQDLSMAPRVKSAGFELFPGEIVGLAGMVGSGRSEIAHAIFGSMERDTGSVTVMGAPYNSPTPKKSIELGIGFLTEDRKGQGLLPLMDASANISAPSLREVSVNTVINRNKEFLIARNEIERFDIAVPGPRSGVWNLSGGNQQKILFARWSRVCHRVLILDEPTRGVDVGAKVEIYKMIRQLADEGIAILVISSELPEIVGLCSRVLVLREGVMTGELSGEDVNEKAIMRLATLQDAA